MLARSIFEFSAQQISSLLSGDLFLITFFINPHNQFFYLMHSLQVMIPTRLVQKNKKIFNKICIKTVKVKKHLIPLIRIYSDLPISFFL